MDLAALLHLDAAQIAALSVLTGGVVRAMRPYLPATALPWVAMGLGVLLGLGGGAVADTTPPALLRAAVEGLLAGSLAIAGKSSLAPVVRSLAPSLADAVFGASKAEPVAVSVQPAAPASKPKQRANRKPKP